MFMVIVVSFWNWWKLFVMWFGRMILRFIK